MPESARLLGRPPAEWLNVMDRRDALYAVLQLQRDAGLMSSNLMVLHQYAIALRHMSTEVLHTVLGWELLPSGAVEDAAPVPRVLRASTQMTAMGLGVPQLVRSVPGQILRTMTKTVQVVSFVIHGRPVSS